MKKALQLGVAVAVVFFALSPVVEASTCTISQQCSSGSTISCSGPAGTCSSGSNYVSCNGTVKNCPPPPCGISYMCEYGGTLTCYSQTGRCYTLEFETVGCDDRFMSCAECYPNFYCSF